MGEGERETETEREREREREREMEGERETEREREREGEGGREDPHWRSSFLRSARLLPLPVCFSRLAGPSFTRRG